MFNKNGPIVLLALLCSAAIFSSLAISLSLFAEFGEMEKELKEGMAQFKTLADQSWETLFREGQNDRPKRQADYFAPMKKSGGICQCAPSSQNCPKGPPGPSGEKGENGTPGQSGPPGKPGASGGIFVFERVKPPCIRCPQGEAGQKGPTGQPGRPGPDGPSGENGQPGKDAQQGPKGAPGEFGPAGLAGKTGDMGPSGESVSTWASVGTPGAKGSPGPSGPPGELGPSGQNGQPGRDGLPGAAGQPGPPGEPGMPGSAGKNGSPGEEGAEKNYCPCPPRSVPAAPEAGPNYSGGRKGVRAGVVKLRSAPQQLVISKSGVV